MKTRLLLIIFLLVVTINISGCNLLLASSATAPTVNKAATVKASVSQTWYEGGEGYNQAYSEFQTTKAPAVVYFYTDW